MLLPKYLISKLTDGEVQWKNIWTTSNVSKASLEATYRRMSFLNRDPSALVIHKNGNFYRFVVSANFDFFIEKSPLSPEQKNVCVCVNIKDESYPADFETVDALEWINPTNKNFTLERIYSSSIILNNGYTYTILTYDDDCIFKEE